jgi:hypothetical protein
MAELLPSAELERLRDVAKPEREPCPHCGAVAVWCPDGAWVYGHAHGCPLWRQLPGDPDDPSSR